MPVKISRVNKTKTTSDYIYPWASRSCDWAHCSILQLYITLEQSCQGTIQGCTEREVLLIYSCYLSYFQWRLVSEASGIAHFTRRERRKEGRVCLVWLFRPVMNEGLYQSDIQENNCAFFNTTAGTLNYDCFKCGSLCLVWTLCQTPGSDGDVTLALNKYLHHSSDSWRPRVQPSVCPPSRSAHPGSRLTPAHSERMSVTWHDRKTKTPLGLEEST